MVLKLCMLELWFIYLFISFFFNLGDPFNALVSLLFFLGAQVAHGHT